eukprot:g4979.t1
MEQLRDFFPALPEQRLLTALSLNGNNVSAAAQFLLNENENIVNSEVGTITSTLTYNNFNNDEEESSLNGVTRSGVNNNSSMSNSQQSSASIFSVASPPAVLINNITNESNSPHQHEEESPVFTIGARIRYGDFYASNSDEDDESDDDFSVDNYLETYENNNSHNVFAIPSQRRKKIYVQDENKSENENSSKLYWVLFDNQIMKKSHIDLLNVQLSKTSHSRVAILSQDATILSKDEASVIFARYFHGNWDNRKDTNYDLVQNERESMFLFHKNSEDRKKNKIINDHGFWAQYFSVNDLNTVWRTLVAQTFFWGDRFVATVSAIKVVAPTDGLITSNRLTFDGAMYDTERGVRNAMERNCVIIVPCKVDDAEIYRHGVSLLSIQSNISTQPLYFQKCKLKQDNNKYIEKKRKKISRPPGKKGNDRIKMKIIEDYIEKEEEHIHSSVYKILKKKIANKLSMFSPGKTPSKFKNSRNGVMTNKNKRRRIELHDNKNHTSNHDNKENVKYKNGFIDDEDIQCEHCFYKLSGIIWTREV